MISEQTKAAVIARLKVGENLDSLADEFEVPSIIIQDWVKDTKGLTLIKAEAQTFALEQVMSGVLVDEVDEEQLKKKLEEAAESIADEIKGAVRCQDVAVSKSLELCANTISKLYATFVLKGGLISPDAANPTQNSLFQTLLKD